MNVHMAFGLAVVAALFVLSVLVLLRTRQVVLAVSGIALAGFTDALGLGQTQLLADDLHWIVEIAHLILGLSAVGVAAVLARTLKGT